MDFINYALVIFIFCTLVVMFWLWQRLSSATGKLDSELEELRRWQQEHLHIEKWATLLERSIGSLSFGLVLVEPDLTVALVNQHAEQILGKNVSQMKGQNYKTALSLTHEDGKPIDQDQDPLLHVFQTRQPMERQHYQVQVGGVPRAVDVSWIPVYNGQDEIIGAAIILLDVARQKALEQMKVDFVSIVSHELRTPITAIKGYIDILLHETHLDPEHAEMLRRVYASNERQLETVESLLNLSRLERGTVPIHPQEFQMEELASQVVGEVDAQAKAKGLEVKFDYPRFALPKVWGDPARTREVLLNLCTNAIKYTDSGWIRVDLSSKDAQMIITVTDSGPGISPDIQKKLFEKFQRGEAALTESKQGMGLGLYITKQFVELMGGKIWLQSEVGKGSTFGFSLPLK